MILADKIIELRKRNGWSQEELAEKLDMSRQSVSKWEGALSVPDMNKILKLSEVFGVSTDFLLKDELEFPDGGRETPVDTDSPAVRVTMEEAAGFLDAREESSARIALGVMLCILSPVVLLILTGLLAGGRIHITELQSVGIGLTVLLTMIGAAVALFVMTGIRNSRYEYLEKEELDTEYGVTGMVNERREKYRPRYAMLLTLGIALCVISAIPVFVATMPDEENAFLISMAAAATLAIVSIGVFMIVRSCVVWSGFSILLEEGDYSRRSKKDEKTFEPIASIYWAVVTAGYLGYSFITNDWARSWIVWPVAGVLYGALTALLKTVWKGKR